VDLKRGAPQTVTWQGTMTSVNAPWIAVVTPDDDFAQRQEIVGAVRPQ
jgi:hypothetical protein